MAIQSGHLARVKHSGFDLSRVSMPRVFVALGLCVFLGISLLLLQRRWVGAFENSLSVLQFTFCLIVAGLFCASLKWAVETTPPQLTPRAGWTFGGMLCGVLTLLSGVLFPLPWNWWTAIGTLFWLVLVGWFCLSRSSVQRCQHAFEQYFKPVITDFFQQAALRPVSPEGTGEAPLPMSIVSANATTSKGHSAVDHGHSAPLGDSEAIESETFLKFVDYTPDPAGLEAACESGVVTNSFVRRVESNGDDVLEAHATAQFPAGAKQTVLHVPFTPAFAVAPQVECEVADGSEVRLKVGAIFPYGMRIELKRNGSDLAERSVIVDVFAVNAASRCVE